MWVVIENKYAKDKKIGYAELETIDKDDGDEWLSVMYRINEDNDLDVYVQCEIDEDEIRKIIKTLAIYLDDEGLWED
jgi:hypothetical protein